MPSVFYFSLPPFGGLKSKKVPPPPAGVWCPLSPPETSPVFLPLKAFWHSSPLLSSSPILGKVSPARIIHLSRRSVSMSREERDGKRLSSKVSTPEERKVMLLKYSTLHCSIILARGGMEEGGSHPYILNACPHSLWRAVFCGLLHLIAPSCLSFHFPILKELEEKKKEGGRGKVSSLCLVCRLAPTTHCWRRIRNFPPSTHFFFLTTTCVPFSLEDEEGRGSFFFFFSIRLCLFCQEREEKLAAAVDKRESFSFFGVTSEGCQTTAAAK